MDLSFMFKRALGFENKRMTECRVKSACATKVGLNYLVLSLLIVLFDYERKIFLHALEVIYYHCSFALCHEDSSGLRLA